MTETVKKVNYTEQQAAEMAAAYKANPSDETLAYFAEKFGKTIRSVRQRLVRDGVYQKKEYVNKNGEKPVKKDATADAIARILGLSDGEADSLAKANKSALVKVFNALANSVPMESADETETA